MVSLGPPLSVGVRDRLVVVFMDDGGGEEGDEEEAPVLMLLVLTGVGGEKRLLIDCARLLKREDDSCPCDADRGTHWFNGFMDMEGSPMITMCGSDGSKESDACGRWGFDVETHVWSVGVGG